MHVQVRDGLATIGTVVDHDAETLGKVKLTAQLGGHEQQMTQRRLVFRGGLAYAGNGLARHNEYMRRSLRRDIVESHAHGVLVDQLRGNLAVSDFLEKRLRGAHKSDYSTTTVRRPRPCT